MSFNRPEQQEAPVVNLVDEIIQKAIKQSASDIHFEPTAHNLRVRYRIDGMLYDQEPVPKTIMNQLLSRLKVLAHINIADRRVPHDGKFTVIRYATCRLICAYLHFQLCLAKKLW